MTFLSKIFGNIFFFAYTFFLFPSLCNQSYIYTAHCETLFRMQLYEKLMQNKN